MEKKEFSKRAVFERMKLPNPRAVTKVAMPGQPATDGSSSNEPARRAGAMRPSLLAVDLLRSLLARISGDPAQERETSCQASRFLLHRARRRGASR
jgi:hypothetical protein